MQQWRGLNLSATEFGWEDQGSRFVPRQGYERICPKEISGEIKCSCKKGCSNFQCSCFKNNFKCSITCKCGIECQNHDEENDSCVDLAGVSSESESDSD